MKERQLGLLVVHELIQLLRLHERSIVAYRLRFRFSGALSYIDTLEQVSLDLLTQKLIDLYSVSLDIFLVAVGVVLWL